MIAFEHVVFGFMFFRYDVLFRFLRGQIKIFVTMDVNSSRLAKTAPPEVLGYALSLLI